MPYLHERLDGDSHMAVPALFEDVCIVDADTHLTEPHDLWTSRAPAAFRDRVPQVNARPDGTPTWVVDGVTVGKAGGAAVVKADGSKVGGIEFFAFGIEDVHPGAYSAKDRLDDHGRARHLGTDHLPEHLWPRRANLRQVARPRAPIAHRDAVQRRHGRDAGKFGRPLGADGCAAVVGYRHCRRRSPARARAWACAGSTRPRRRTNMACPISANPTGTRYGRYAAASSMPVNFHIGAAESDIAWFGTVGWPSLGMNQKLAVGSAMLYLNNGACLANMIFSGVLERYPTLQIVSVESGVGWFPFFMQALDHQASELPPGTLDYLSLPPSGYFKRQIHACFWFETPGLARPSMCSVPITSCSRPTTRIPPAPTLMASTLPPRRWPTFPIQCGGN